MFKNRNTKIINKVVRKILKTQMIKNGVTILAIIISAMLFTSLTTLIDGTVKSQTLMMQMQAGSKADAEVKGLTKKQYEMLIKSSAIEAAGLRRPGTYLTNTQHHNIEIDYLDDKAQDMYFSKPTHGTAPKKINEIATSDRALRELGIEPKVGEKVKIVFQLQENNREYSYEMVVSGWWEAINEQSSIMLVSDEFMDQNTNLFENNRKYDFELGRYSAELILKNRFDVETDLKKEVQTIGGELEDQKSENFTPVVMNRNNSVDLKEFILPVLLIAILFFICSYLLIYNIFDIAVAKDIKIYGLLSTLGTTPSQMWKIVFRQALYLAVIGIPIGLLIGYFIGEKLLPIMTSGMFAEEYSNVLTVNSANPIIFAIGAFMTLMTIFISIYRPAKLATRYNAIEAANYTEINKTTKNHIFKNKIYQMAYINFSRNRKRTVLIVISLSICTILFNSVFIISSSMDKKKFISVNMKTDYIAANANAFNLDKGFVFRSDGMSEEFCNFLENLSGIEKIGYLYKNTKEDNQVSFDYGIDVEKVESYPNDDGVMEKYGVINIDGIELGAPLSDDGRLRCNVYGADRTTLVRFQFGETLNGMSEDEIRRLFMNGNYIIEGAVIDPNNPTEVSEIPGYQCSVGQKVTAYKNGKKFKTYTVIAHIPVIQAEVEANDGANGATRVGQDAAKFYLPLSEFERLYDNPTLLNCTFDATTEDAKKTINSELEEYVEEDPSMGYYSSEELLRAINSEQKKLYIVGGIMAGVLGIVGIINFMNLVVTSVISRRDEFAVMESIGMTGKQLKKMIICEGFFYASLTGILGLVAAYCIGATIIKQVLSFTWYYTFKMTLIPGIVIWIGMLFIVILSSNMAMDIFNKGDLSERLSVGV